MAIIQKITIKISYLSLTVQCTSRDKSAHASLIVMNHLIYCKFQYMVLKELNWNYLALHHWPFELGKE